MRSDAVRTRVSRLLDLPNGEAVAAVLCVIFALGGSGLGYPVLQAIVQIAALLLLGLVFARSGTEAIRRIGRIEWTILALIVLVPTLQLVPLPASWWAVLPGHALPAQILQAAGIASAARPISLSTPDTIQALAALLPGIALFVAAKQLSRSGRRTLLWTILALALASTALAAVQVALGAAAAPSYASAQAGQGIGLFVNRNHQATFLLIALCLCGALLGRGAKPGRRALVAVVMFLCTVGVLATTSRTGLILLPLCLATVGLREPWAKRGRGIALAGAGIGLIALLWFTGILGRTLDRFDGGPDARLAFWRTGVEAARAYWPQGSGIGSFTRVYSLFERREDIGSFFVNHAHQEYLELLIEGGALAAAGIALFILWYCRTAIRLKRGGASSSRREHWSIFFAIAVVLAFSTVEYPVRAAPVMALFGLLCGLLDPFGITMGASPLARRTTLWRLVASGFLVLAGGTWIAMDGASRHLLADGKPALALRLQPFSTDSRDALASDALHAGRLQEATVQAQSALTIDPTDQGALTILSMTIRKHRPADANALLALSAKLGWRDPTTQIWLIGMFGDRGEMAAAAERADALLRAGVAREAVTQILRRGVANAGFAGAVAAQLSARPPWRYDYLMGLDDLQAAEAPGHAQVLRAMTNAGASPTNVESAAFVARLETLGLDDLAAATWRAASGGTIGDPKFAGVGRDIGVYQGLFGWQIGAPSAVSAERDAGSTTLIVDGAVAGLVLYQNLLLAPGRYRFSVDLPAPAGASSPYGWTASCLSDGSRLDAGQQWDSTRRRLTLDFEVPPDCVSQRIGLHVDGGGMELLRLALGRASLTPISPHY